MKRFCEKIGEDKELRTQWKISKVKKIVRKNHSNKKKVRKFKIPDIIGYEQQNKITEEKQS